MDQFSYLNILKNDMEPFGAAEAILINDELMYIHIYVCINIITLFTILILIL